MDNKYLLRRIVDTLLTSHEQKT